MTKRNRKAGVVTRSDRLCREYGQLAALFESKRFQALEVAAREFVRRYPTEACGKKILGACLLGLERYSEALPHLQVAARGLPRDPEAQGNLAIALRALEGSDQALVSFEKSIADIPNDADLRLKAAKLYREVGKLGEAASHLHAALALNSKNTDCLRELGLVTLAAGAFDAARQVFEHVLELGSGDDPATLYALGTSLRGLGRHREASIAFHKAHLIDPGVGQALLHAIHMDLHLCSWGTLKRDVEALFSILDTSSLPAVDPFPLIAIPGVTSSRLLRVAQAHAKIQTTTRRLAASEMRLASRGVGARIRVGYLSCDFHAHATSDLLVGVIEAHDRDAFEVFGYSYGPDDGSEMCRRIRAAFDVFRDVADFDYLATAVQIKMDEIDILVDLKGWTKDTRTPILNCRAAPVQVNWLGYPGTLGLGQEADYIIGDRRVTPLEAGSQYSEKLALLPDSYQPNDNRRPIGQSISRREAGLPEDAFVYCSFNQAYKLNPAVVDLWSRVLRDSPNSVLWLLSPGSEAEGNLKDEFGRRGVSETRIVFAPRLAAKEHLARLSLADVALDTFPCGSHTTASDALWAGVPLITIPGETFASRVGASLVAAAGCPELIAYSEADYLEKALELFRDRDCLKAVKQYLGSAGRNSPLFDTGRFTRNLEALFGQMLERKIAGDHSAIVLPEALHNQ